MDIQKNILSVLILGYLRKNCRGRAAARTQGRIASDLRGLGLDVDTRNVRDALAALVLAGAPVGTVAGKPPGAFVCEDRRDYLGAYANLYRRVVCQAKRARRFKETAPLLKEGGGP